MYSVHSRWNPGFHLQHKTKTEEGHKIGAGTKSPPPQGQLWTYIKNVFLSRTREPMPGRQEAFRCSGFRAWKHPYPTHRTLRPLLLLAASSGECQRQVTSSWASPSLSGFPYASLVMKSGYLIFVKVWKTFAPKFLLKYERRIVLA